MGPLCNPRTILHGAHFSAHFIPIWAPHTNVGWAVIQFYMKKMQGCLFHILTNPMHFRNLNQRWVCPCLTKTCLEFSIDILFSVKMANNLS